MFPSLEILVFTVQFRQMVFRRVPVLKTSAPLRGARQAHALTEQNDKRKERL